MRFVAPMAPVTVMNVSALIRLPGRAVDPAAAVAEDLHVAVGRQPAGSSDIPTAVGDDDVVVDLDGIGVNAWRQRHCQQGSGLERFQSHRGRPQVPAASADVKLRRKNIFQSVHIPLDPKRRTMFAWFLLVPVPNVLRAMLLPVLSPST